jgi:hypothetical protein
MEGNNAPKINQKKYCIRLSKKEKICRSKPSHSALPAKHFN